MKKYFIHAVAIVCLTPFVLYSQDDLTEGAFAMQLASALKLGQPATESEAQELLRSVGVAPKDGWDIDDLMAPVEIGEVRDSLLIALGAGKLSMQSDEALNAFSDAAGILPPEAPRIVNNYYYPPSMGYADPYAMYSYPFYGYGAYGSFFPGFYGYDGFGFRNRFGHNFKFNHGLRSTFGFNHSGGTARIWNLPTPRPNRIFSIRSFDKQGFNRGFSHRSFAGSRGGIRGGSFGSGGFRSSGFRGGMRSGGRR